MPDMARWVGVIASVVGLDQLTKLLVAGSLHLGERVQVLPFFDLVYVFNPGAAFSFLADHSGWQRWFFVALAVVICGWLSVLLKRHASERLMPAACALIIGGAIGNVIDRLIHGAVIDFLYFYVGRYGWPAFNVADSAITVGAVLMVWAEWKTAQKEARNKVTQ